MEAVALFKPVPLQRGQVLALRRGSGGPQKKSCCRCRDQSSWAFLVARCRPKKASRLRALGNVEDQKMSRKLVKLPKKEPKLDQRHMKELCDKGCRDDVAPVLAEIVYDEALEKNLARGVMEDQFNSTSETIIDSFTMVRNDLRSINESIKSLDAKVEALAAVPTFLQVVQISVVMLGVFTAIIKFLP